jgi:hypothetical protein
VKKQDQISKAVKLLMPRDTAAARKYVGWAITNLNVAKSENHHLEDLAAKKSRKSLEAFQKAIDRARVAFTKMPDGMRIVFDRSIEIEGHKPIPFDAAISACRKVLAAPHRRSKIDYVGLNAAASAWNLFGLLDLPNPPLTRGGKWPKLAAILVNSDEDMFHHCRLYKRGASSGPK